MKLVIGVTYHLDQLGMIAWELSSDPSTKIISIIKGVPDALVGKKRPWAL